MSESYERSAERKKKRQRVAAEELERDIANGTERAIAGRDESQLISTVERASDNSLIDRVAAVQHPLLSSSLISSAAAASPVPTTATTLQNQALIAELIRQSTASTAHTLRGIPSANARTAGDRLQSLIAPVSTASQLAFTQHQPQIASAPQPNMNMSQLCSLLAALQSTTPQAFRPLPVPPRVPPPSAEATQAAILSLLPLLQSNVRNPTITNPPFAPPAPPPSQGIRSNPQVLQEALALLLRSNSSTSSTAAADARTGSTALQQSSFASTLSQSPRPALHRSMLLSLPSDSIVLSEYQVLLREQIELFEATPDDTRPYDQGRKRQIVIGQVGIRCRYCQDVVRAARSRGAVYFPVRMENLYQAGQNMGSNHFCRTCPRIPSELKEKMVRLAQESSRSSTSGSGKKYWSDGVKALGVVELENGGLRFADRLES